MTNISNTTNRPFPIFGALSVAMTPLTALLVYLSVAILDTFVDKPGSVSMSALLPGVAHASAPILLACVAEGVGAAVIALLSRERPRWLPILGLTMTASLIGLFMYFE